MKFGSLFSGIGGIDLGLERAGMECIWQVEIDEFCLKVLEKHWPNVVKYKDVHTITELSYVDLICGGFPCQPVSLTGKRRGVEDERWLWPEFDRIIRLVRPRYVFVENVPGLFSQGMSEVLGDLATCGYDAEWDCISAETVGAPHQRKRVFIIAYSRSMSNYEHVEVRRIFNEWKSLQRQRSKNWIELVMDSGKVAPSKWRKTGEIDTQPLLIRNNDGFSNGMDRLKSLGNAVVPQVAEWIGKKIMELG